MTNSPTSLLDFIRRRVGVGELVRRRVDRNSSKLGHRNTEGIFTGLAPHNCGLSVCLYAEIGAMRLVGTW